MSLDDQIRISEGTREELRRLKEAGQSYDDVIGELLARYRESHRAELFDRMNRREQAAPVGFTALGDLES